MSSASQNASNDVPFDTESFKNLLLTDNKLPFDDEIVGNVSKYVAYPMGSSETLQPGNLIFHACFQSGNLGRVDCISLFEYDLFVRPDTCNPRYRMWFNFTVQNVTVGQRVLFNIVNFSKTKSLFREGMSPFVKSTSRPNWQRIPSKNVFYYRCPDHGKNYVMSFAFAFDETSDVYQFAYGIPYTYSRLQSYLSDIEKLNYDFFIREQLCTSIQQRRVDLLTITSPKNLHEDKQRKVVFFTARVHPGETPASYVCQGIIDFLISNNSVAQVLREHIVFMIVPMLNPDGVVLGNYRCSLMGFDLNRFWVDPSAWAHPSILATKQLLQDLNENQSVSLEFYIDLHAHSTAMNGFMYGNVYDDEYRFEQHSVFPRLLDTNSEDFSFNGTSFNQDTVKAGTGRRTLGSCLSHNTNCYTLEVSFFGYLYNSNFYPYTEDRYLKLGLNVAKTFLDFYKLNQMVVHRFNAIVENENKNHKYHHKNNKLESISSSLHKRSDSLDLRNGSQRGQRSRKLSLIEDSNRRSSTSLQLKYKHRNSTS